MFYPSSSRELQCQVDQLLAQIEVPQTPAPKALITPHAGYVFSGPIAASAYGPVIPVQDRIQRVLLLGPSHRVAFRGIAAGSWDAFSTPLGNIPVDWDGLRPLVDEGQIRIFDEAHAQEHSLEVQLPFLQRVLSEFRLLPLVIGDATPQQVSAILQRLWGGSETLIVVSSDLSHYHPYELAQRIDKATSRAIEALRDEAIGYEEACGRTPICGLLRALRHRGMRVQTIDLRNSGDTAGDHDRVVGYGAYLAH
jgi:hypothetical protein